MLPLLLIDTRDPEPEPAPQPRGTGLADAFAWLFPWPAVIVWLWLGGIVLTGVPGMLFAVSALLVSFWRLSKVYPTSGLSDHRQ